MERDGLVTVIMPVYNSERYVAKSIESILNQTYTNFEFLIFDDGSTDNSREIISSFASGDNRIIPFYSDVNLGYVTHLNKGILLAKGDLIARMDSDDIAMADRLQAQVDFLWRNSDVAVVGSSSIVIDADGRDVTVSNRNISPEQLFWQSFFTNPISHPTVMFRRSVILNIGMYDPLKMPSEDYDLWVRVLRHSKIANLEMPLLRYREHSLSISKVRSEEQRMGSIQTLIDHWRFYLKKPLTHDVASFLKNFHKGYELQSISSIRMAYISILNLYFKHYFRKGFVDSVKKDVFGILLYLTLRARVFSVITFLHFGALTSLFFPWQMSRRLILRR